MIVDKVMQIARVCYEANRAYAKTLGDTSFASWEFADERDKETVIKGVLFHISNPGASPEDSHNSWWDEKKSLGWQFGSVKDIYKKEHPCCVPYSELPDEQKRKDSLFIAIVNALK